MPRKRELHDAYFKQAKAEGYVARSAYKLLQIQQRRRLLRPGDRVLDLGCAPGSWMQVAAQIVGPRGLVLGLDLQPAAAPLPPHARTLVGDVFAIDARLLADAAGPGLFDAVLSDMAPNTTGAGDDFRSAALCERVLDLLADLLKPGGVLAMKIFEGERYPHVLARAARHFGAARGYKPDATRDVSREMYILAEGYRGDGPSPPAPARRPDAAAAPSATPGPGSRARPGANTTPASPPAPREGWSSRG